LRIIELCELRWGGGGATLSQPEWWRVLEYYWPIVDGLIRSWTIRSSLLRLECEQSESGGYIPRVLLCQ